MLYNIHYMGSACGPMQSCLSSQAVLAAQQKVARLAGGLSLSLPSGKNFCCGAVSAACRPPHAARPCCPGLRVGTSQTTTAHFSILHHFDHLLLDKASWPALKPDVVLQLGGHMISKRCGQFLEWAALGGPDRSGWVDAEQEGGRLWCTPYSRAEGSSCGN